MAHPLAAQFKDAGFKVTNTDGGIVISLDNQRVSRQDVVAVAAVPLAALTNVIVSGRGGVRIANPKR